MGLLVVVNAVRIHYPAGTHAGAGQKDPISEWAQHWCPTLLSDTTVKEFQMDPVSTGERERLLDADKFGADMSPRSAAANRV